MNPPLAVTVPLPRWEAELQVSAVAPEADAAAAVAAINDGWALLKSLADTAPGIGTRPMTVSAAISMSPKLALAWPPSVLAVRRVSRPPLLRGWLGSKHFRYTLTVPCQICRLERVTTEVTYEQARDALEPIGIPPSPLPPLDDILRVWRAWPMDDLLQYLQHSDGKSYSYDYIRSFPAALDVQLSTLQHAKGLCAGCVDTITKQLAARADPPEPTLRSKDAIALSGLVTRAREAFSDLIDRLHSLGVDAGPSLGLATHCLDDLEHGRFRFEWSGHSLRGTLAELGSLTSSLPRLFADAYQVDEREARAFLAYFDEYMPPTGAGSKPTFGLPIPCNHRGCHATAPARFSTPSEMVEARRRSGSEVWYCHDHLWEAWESEHALPDYVRAILQKVSLSPGCSMSAAGADRRSLDFLERADLVRAIAVPRSNGSPRYEMFLTEKGDRLNAAFAHAGTNRRGR